MQELDSQLEKWKVSEVFAFTRCDRSNAFDCCCGENVLEYCSSKQPKSGRSFRGGETRRSCRNVSGRDDELVLRQNSIQIRYVNALGFYVSNVCLSEHFWRSFHYRERVWSFVCNKLSKKDR